MEFLLQAGADADEGNYVRTPHLPTPWTFIFAMLPKYLCLALIGHFPPQLQKGQVPLYWVCAQYKKRNKMDPHVVVDQLTAHGADVNAAEKV